MIGGLCDAQVTYAGYANSPPGVGGLLVVLLFPGMPDLRPMLRDDRAECNYGRSAAPQ